MLEAAAASAHPACVLNVVMSRQPCCTVGVRVIAQLKGCVSGPQVVVFALGIGTSFDDAERLIAAFKGLCGQCQEPWTPLLTSLQEPSAVQSQLTSSGHQQALSLREAFFACTVRSVTWCDFWTVCGLAGDIDIETGI